jgi:hypothetical protein
MRSYRASGAAPFGGVILLLLIAVASGLIVGGILWAVDNYLSLYLVVLFPLLAAAIVGGILTLLVRGVKIRSPLLAGLIGLIGGLLIYATYHYATYYVSFRNAVRDSLVESGAKSVSDAELDELINEQLQVDFGDTGFVGYLKLAAQDGITITRTTSISSESGIELKDNVLLGYWGLEWLLVALGVAVATGRAANDPFDEKAGTWYGPPMLVAMTDKKSRKEFLKALKAGDYAKAGSFLTTQPLNYPRTEVVTRRAQDPAADVYIQVRTAPRQGRFTIDRRGMMTANEFADLRRAMAQPPVERTA